jgi:hypothetical protein
MSVASTRDVVNTHKFQLKREIMLIPWWAVALAVIVFVTVPVLFFGFVWSDVSDAPTPFRFLVSFFPGTVLAFMALMVGYVNTDAKRRGMNRALWTILVIIIPNAIGFILYFLLRAPIRAECPKCGTIVDPRVNYCPRCRYSFHPTCPQCKLPVQTGDTFCANCGTPLSEEKREP